MGEGRKKWKFLEAMDNVLADKPSTHPTTLIDTSSDDPVNETSTTASEEQRVDENDVTLNDDDRAHMTTQTPVYFLVPFLLAFFPRGWAEWLALAERNDGRICQGSGIKWWNVDQIRREWSLRNICLNKKKTVQKRERVPNVNVDNDVARTTF